MKPPSSRRRQAFGNLASILTRFSGVRVLVIGDLMLDRYIWGQVNRISPEAPVPVVRVTRESLHAGGAGNVVTNIRALGGRVTVCGVVGKDQAGRLLRKALRGHGAGVEGMLTSSRYETISKTRIIAHSQQVVRLDRDPTESLSARVRARLRTFIQRHIHDCDVCVVSDYGKGLIEAELLDLLATLRRQRDFVYVIDPKRQNFGHYHGASLIKPNKEEAGQATQIDIVNDAALHQAGSQLLELWDTEAVLVSRGEEGMSLFQPDRRAAHFSTTAREVFDVTGAGDTVIAVCALALGAGAGLEAATILANHAAGVVVGKVGTASVNPKELKTALRTPQP